MVALELGYCFLPYYFALLLLVSNFPALLALQYSRILIEYLIIYSPRRIEAALPRMEACF